jgi:hypothetical protein
MYGEMMIHYSGSELGDRKGCLWNFIALFETFFLPSNWKNEFS